MKRSGWLALCFVIFLPYLVRAGNCSTKTVTIDTVLASYFDKREISSIKRNHPQLTPFIAQDILVLLESLPEWHTLSIEQIYAKFIIQASIRTGFRSG